MTEQVLALSGGIGGAKLALGLSRVLDPDDLLIVANTGDDFEHLGFYICPDIDTLIYTLGGVSNTETGWGRAEETWSFMDALQKNVPQQAWFQLGDKDLETHRFRTQALAAGKTLTEVTSALARRFEVRPAVLPMTDHPVQTHMLVESGDQDSWLPFQEYFVKLRCEPRICDIEYRDSEQASISSQLDAAVSEGNISAIVICPSNPYLSIDPIFSIPGMSELLRSSGAPIVAVSPIVGGRALKGPTAKIMNELGLASDVAAIAKHYQGLVDGLVLDHRDSAEADRIRDLGMAVTVTQTVMRSLRDREQLARDVLEFSLSVRKRR